MDDDLKNKGAIAKGAAIGIVFSSLCFVLAFFFKLLAARYYGPEDFGVFALTQTILGLLVSVGGLGIAEGIGRYIPYYQAKKDPSLGSYVRFIFSLPLLFSLFLGLLLFFGADLVTLFFGFPEILSPILQVIAIFIPIRVLNKLFGKILVSQRMIFLNQFAAFLEKLILLVGIGVILMVQGSLFLLIAVLVASIVLSWIFRLAVYLWKIRLPLSSKSRGDYADWVFFSFPLFISGMFGFFISWTDNRVIGKLMDASSLGIYSVAFSVGSFLIFAQGSFSPIFLPVVSRSHGKGDKRQVSLLFRKSASWVLGVTMPMFIIILLFGRYILEFFFGPEYVAAYIPLVIVATGYIINVSTGICKEILLVHKKTRIILTVNVLLTLFNIAMNLILIPVFGIIGAAISTATTMAAINMAFLFIAKKFERISLDWSFNLRLLIISVISISLSLLLLNLIHDIYLRILVSLVVFLVSYIILGISFRIMDNDDIRLLEMFMKRFGLKGKAVKMIRRLER